mmetsp:Transcript_43365/g.107132  ORF Transcript_43365/g.107132 Transcript_43365/m.107132 type:complete len:218 (-) Transcript_43365:490-1143(-)
MSTRGRRTLPGPPSPSTHRPTSGTLRRSLRCSSGCWAAANRGGRRRRAAASRAAHAQHLRLRDRACPQTCLRYSAPSRRHKSPGLWCCGWGHTPRPVQCERRTHPAETPPPRICQARTRAMMRACHGSCSCPSPPWLSPRRAPLPVRARLRSAAPLRQVPPVGWPQRVRAGGRRRGRRRGVASRGSASQCAPRGTCRPLVRACVPGPHYASRSQPWS